MEVLVFRPGTGGFIPANYIQAIEQSGVYLEMNLGLTLNYWVNPVKEFVNFVSKQSDGYCTVDRVLYGVNTCLVKKLNLSYFKLRYF